MLTSTFVSNASFALIHMIEWYLCEGSLPDTRKPPPFGCVSYQPVAFSLTTGASSLACLASRKQQQGAWIMLSMLYACLNMFDEGVCLAWYLARYNCQNFKQAATLYKMQGVSCYGTRIAAMKLSKCVIERPVGSMRNTFW